MDERSPVDEKVAESQESQPEPMTEREIFIEQVIRWRDSMKAWEAAEGDMKDRPKPEFLPDGVWDVIPQPLYWRVLVVPLPAEEKTKGGIILGGGVKAAQEYNTHAGVIVWYGSEAWKSDKFANSDWPQMGDFVLLSRYSGHRFEFAGQRLILVNEDELIATLEDPTKLKCYI